MKHSLREGWWVVRPSESFDLRVFELRGDLLYNAQGVVQFYCLEHCVFMHYIGEILE